MSYSMVVTDTVPNQFKIHVYLLRVESDNNLTILKSTT